MSLKSMLALPLILATLAAAFPSAADVLLIEEVRERTNRDLPRNGLSMQTVESRYGSPKVKHDPRGADTDVHPRITRWEYEDYSVYFERELVIESALHSGAVLEALDHYSDLDD